MDQSKRPKIFISHIGEEAAIGFTLKHWIEDAFTKNVDVFLSSDKEDIAGGQRWLDRIAQELRDDQARYFISILSPISVTRPWILMEFGAAWIRDIPVFPLCHGRLTPAKLQRPLNDFNGGSIDQTNIGDLILNGISKQTGLRYPTGLDFAKMQAELNKEASACTTAPAVQYEAPKATDGLDDEQVRLLQLLAEMHDRGEAEVPGSNLAESLGMKLSRFEMLIARLTDRKFVHGQYFANERETEYAIGPKGLEALNERGLL